jgi:hypothetical protein
MTKFTRKSKIAIVTTALVLGVSGTAFAYWTNAGGGTGSGTTGTNVAVTVTQTSTVTALYPGGPAQALSGTFTNPNAGAVTVGAVSGVVSSTGVVGCDPLWYVVTGTDAGAPHVLGAGTGGTWSGQSVALTNNLTVNQDLCKSATITITYTVAAGPAA